MFRPVGKFAITTSGLSLFVEFTTENYDAELIGMKFKMELQAEDINRGLNVHEAFYLGLVEAMRFLDDEVKKFVGHEKGLLREGVA